MAGIGAHEVIIESPYHDISMADALRGEHPRGPLGLPRPPGRPEEGPAAGLRHALQERRRRRRGASLEHSHSQLIVTPIVPISVWEEMTGSLEFFNYRGRCIYCDMVQQELSAEKRIVLDTPHFTAFCPYASRFPFETWILPKTHSSHFENIPKPGVDDLGTVLTTGPEQAGAGARQPGLQLHHPHRAVRPPGAAALPLAHRDHPAADARWPASSGARASTSTPCRPRTPPASSARSRSSTGRPPPG